jgi:hypothetical protein
MRATVRERVPGSRIAEAVPPPYRDDIVKQVDPQGTYTLLLCAHHPRDINLSAQVKRAFKRVDSVANDGIIIVGSVFTEEAKAVAAEHGARIVALHKSVWTDESARQRQL